MAGASLHGIRSEDEKAGAPRSGNVPTRKDGGEIGIGVDICIRFLGLAGIIFAAAVIRWLHAYIQRHAVPDAPLWLLAAIAIAFLSASMGCGCVALGRHIHDRIEVAERWRRRL